MRDRSNPGSASSLDCVVSDNLLNPSMLQFPSLEVRMMKTALSSMATVGLHEILVVKLFSQGLAHRQCWANISGLCWWYEQRDGTQSCVEVTSCLYMRKRKKKNKPERERVRGREEEKVKPVGLLTAFQDLLLTDMRLGCPPYTEVQGNNFAIPSRRLLRTSA